MCVVSHKTRRVQVPTARPRCRMEDLFVGLDLEVRFYVQYKTGKVRIYSYTNTSGSRIP
jgi:hypothetical protein